MSLRPARNRRMGLRHRTATRVDQVDAGKQAPAQVRVRRIDTGIEERDRYSGAVEAGNLEPPHRRRRDIQRLGNLRGERGPNRVDGRDLAVAGHERERGRIEARRESVQHAHVAIVGRDASSRGRHPGEKLLLHPDRGPASMRASAPLSPDRRARGLERRARAPRAARRSAARWRRPREHRARPASPLRRATGAASPARAHPPSPREEGPARGSRRPYAADAYASSPRYEGYGSGVR